MSGPVLIKQISSHALNAVPVHKDQRFFEKYHLNYTKQDGHRLNLSYITPQLIVMSYPGKKTGNSSNKVKDVHAFFKHYHQHHFKVYNLCTERSYPPKVFPEYAHFPVNPMKPCTFREIIAFCQDVYLYLDEDPKNVAVLHEKGEESHRVQFMACAFLMFKGICTTVKCALRLYSDNRERLEPLPSHRRYLEYFCRYLMDEEDLSPNGSPAKNADGQPKSPNRRGSFSVRLVHKISQAGSLTTKNRLENPLDHTSAVYDLNAVLVITGVRLEGVPRVSKYNSCTPDLSIMDMKGNELFRYGAKNNLKVFNPQSGQQSMLLACTPKPTKVIGDCEILILHKTRPIFSFCLHAGFIEPGAMEVSFDRNQLEVSQVNVLDKEMKKKMKVIPSNFKVTVMLRATATAEKKVKEVNDLSSSRKSVNLMVKRYSTAGPMEHYKLDHYEKNKLKPSNNFFWNKIRSLVSKRKLRYFEDGFNLDLAYITPQVLAMGFPSEGFEGVYRNPIGEVTKFLTYYHKGYYKIYNLCAEKHYAPGNFELACAYPFRDHEPCPFKMMQRFCENVHNHLKLNKDNLAAIHCKAGKGRTGLMICAYLIYSGVCKSHEEAMAFYAQKRTKNQKGVTIPSQKRWLAYFEHYLNNYYDPVLRRLPIVKVQLRQIHLARHMCTSGIYFQITRFGGAVLYTSSTMLHPQAVRSTDTSARDKDIRAMPTQTSRQSIVRAKTQTAKRTEVEDDDSTKLTFDHLDNIPTLDGDVHFTFYKSLGIGKDNDNSYFQGGGAGDIAKHGKRLFGFWLDTSFLSMDRETKKTALRGRSLLEIAGGVAAEGTEEKDDVLTDLPSPSSMSPKGRRNSVSQQRRESLSRLSVGSMAFLDDEDDEFNYAIHLDKIDLDHIFKDKNHKIIPADFWIDLRFDNEKLDQEPVLTRGSIFEGPKTDNISSPSSKKSSIASKTSANLQAPVVMRSASMIIEEDDEGYEEQQEMQNKIDDFNNAEAKVDEIELKETEDKAILETKQSMTNLLGDMIKKDDDGKSKNKNKKKEK